jgi:hypothetical protein
MPTATPNNASRRIIVHLRCQSLDILCSELTVTDVTRLTGIICRENNYNSAMFGYIHTAMKYYLEVKSKELKHSTGEDVVEYFRIMAPIAYEQLKKANALTIKAALKFRDGPKSVLNFI